LASHGRYRTAWQAWRGEAGLGKARQVRTGGARQDTAGLRKAGTGFKPGHHDGQ